MEVKQRDAVDYAFERWVTWSKSELGCNGYPPISLLGKIVKYGIRGASQPTSSTNYDVDKTCEAVDAAVSRLPEPERRVVTHHYFTPPPTKVQAVTVGMSHDNFRRLLSNAKRSVSDYLEGKGIVDL